MIIQQVELLQDAIIQVLTEIILKSMTIEGLKKPLIEIITLIQI